MNLERAIQALCDAKIDFVIVGGVAATLHGSGHVTLDLDICYSRSSTNLRALKEVLAPFHPRPRGLPLDLPFVWDEATLRNSSILTLSTDLGDIDLLGEVAGLGVYDDVRRESKSVTAFDRTVEVVDIRALIKAKRASARPKDLSQIPELEGLLEADEAT